MNNLTKQLISLSAHIGHIKQKWNPNMENYLFGHINNLYIINLEKTLIILNKVNNIIKELINKNKKILIITDNNYNINSNNNIQIIESSLLLNGCLTNLNTIKKIQQNKLNNQNKKNNINYLLTQPDFIILFNINENISIIKEANLLNIPIIALTDSNNNPNLITYPLASNNESYNVKLFYLNYFKNIINKTKILNNISFNNEYNLYLNIKI